MCLWDSGVGWRVDRAHSLFSSSFFSLNVRLFVGQGHDEIPNTKYQKFPSLLIHLSSFLSEALHVEPHGDFLGSFYPDRPTRLELKTTKNP